MNLKKITHSFFIFLGFNIKNFISLIYVPKFIQDLIIFKRMGGDITVISPSLVDFNENAGSAIGHYFNQDLLVANYISNASPQRHIDIASRIDGFVAHVASFRKIEVLDVRPLNKLNHDNIIFIQADLMNINSSFFDITDSISCLHAIEHFGLGRYSDPLDPKGHIKGFNNILSMLKVGGTLYISFPIASTTSVNFNTHRIFNPLEVFKWPSPGNHIELINFDYVDDLGMLHKSVNINTFECNLKYGCGIYTFVKL